MRGWAVRLYRKLAGRRLWLTLLVIAGLLPAFWSSLTLDLDKSLKALLPDNSASLSRGLELLDLAPFSRVLLIQLTAENPALSYQLPEAADRLVLGLDPQLMEPLNYAESFPEPAVLMALLPALCDPDCLERLEKSLGREQIDRALSELKNDLAGPGGLSAYFWRADPLNWRSEIFRRFPNLRGWPTIDPLVGYPLSRDGRRLLIILKPLVSMNDTTGSRAVMANIDALTTQLPAGLSAQIVGAHRHTEANASAIERDLALTLSLALLLILGIYVFLVRSFGALWLFLTPAVAVLLATAALTVFFSPVSGLALGFGAAVLGIAEDYAVHVHFALRRSPDPGQALRHVARPLWMSCVLCLCGFGALLFSSIPAIRQLAFFSAAAILIGYFWAIIILPHCPGMDRPRECSGEPKAPAAASGRALVYPVFAGLGALCLLLAALTPMNASIRELGFAGEELAADQKAVEETWHFDGGRRVYLAEGGSWDEALALAAQAENILNASAPGSASSLSGLIPARDRQEAWLEKWAAFCSGPGQALTRALAEAEQAEYEAGAFEPFRSWFEAEAAELSPDGLSRAGLGSLVDNFLIRKDGRCFAMVLADGQAPALPPSFDDRIFQLSAAGLEETLSRTLNGEKFLLPLCVLLCLSVLTWAFKSVRLAVLAFIPALGGLAAVLLVNLLGGGSLGLIEIAALPLVICLSADYGIVVVSELLENADLGAPKAIFVSGLSTIAGIGILILASHPVLHGLGKTVFAGLAAAMPISIILLPKLNGKK